MSFKPDKNVNKADLEIILDDKCSFIFDDGESFFFKLFVTKQLNDKMRKMSFCLLCHIFLQGQVCSFVDLSVRLTGWYTESHECKIANLFIEHGLVQQSMNTSHFKSKLLSAIKTVLHNPLRCLQYIPVWMLPTHSIISSSLI